MSVPLSYRCLGGPLHGTERCMPFGIALFDLPTLRLDPKSGNSVTARHRYELREHHRLGKVWQHTGQLS